MRKFTCGALPDPDRAIADFAIADADQNEAEQADHDALCRRHAPPASSDGTDLSARQLER